MVLLQTGIAYTLLQNQVYALPAKAVLAASSGVIEVSQDGVVFSPVTLTNGSAALASMFIRSTGVGTILSLKELGVAVTVPGGGGSASLPTAALGQVLISQGAGVNPVLSTDISLIKDTTPQISIRDNSQGADNKAFAIRVGGGDLEIRGVTDIGALMPGISISRYGGMIVNTMLIQGSLDTSGIMRLRETTFVATGDVVGNIANFSDANIGTPGSVITAGGGTNHVLARWNGTNWKVIG